MHLYSIIILISANPEQGNFSRKVRASLETLNGKVSAHFRLLTSD